MKMLCAVILPILAVGKELKVEPLPVSDSAKAGMLAEELAKVGPIVEGFIRKKQLAGANVLVLRKGEIVYQESFGLRDLETKAPMENDTLFRIYSMTKALTSAVALMLCEEGKLSLDDPIEKYLPELAKPEVLVTEGHAVSAKRKP
ncbi:beta-lactamase family protein [Akkermansiaceae bacterium]|nr:beta-lactamase family protein [Akkermansiaceae bacterium]MDA8976837.1 beta-lactamase family protein [bacterium]